MALTINTNITSLIAQRNLNSATAELDKSIQRMTTGYKINSASDNAAGYSIAANWTVQLSSLDVASQNASMGVDLLTTAEESLSLISTHLQRIRDLTEQAANGTYGTTSQDAIKSEIDARLAEITRIQSNAEYNGISLLSEAGKSVTFQVGITKDSAQSQITIAADILKQVSISDINSTKCSGKDSTSPASDQLDIIDTAITDISTKVTAIGACQNRLESAIDSIDIQTQNLTASLSTIKDTDVAEESSNYIKAQILQQASATLMSTANQLPSIALNLI
jgi:flagellin